jgi:enoyl-CoA hydratase
MPVELSRRGPIAVMTLNRPEALNALSFDILREIGARVDELGESDARALVVTGAGDRAFCAGADIKELMNRGLEAQRNGAILGQSVFERLNRLPMPSIAVIDGYAFGGGLELAMACTFRVATPKAKVGQPEIKLGLIPGYGGTQRLPRLVGEARALEICMTGRTVGADEALAIGLVNRLVDDDPVEAAIAFAEEFTCYSMPALRFTRDAVARALDLPIVEGLRVEADLSTLAFQTKDAAEGMSAFAEKREAKFTDD